MKPSIFSRQSRIDAPVKALFRWHGRPGAIERLSPPWDPLGVISQKGGIEEDAEVTLKMKAGPIHYKWYAKHTAYEENWLFRDEQVRGPFSQWIHTHRFEPDGESACFLEDTISYKLPLHPLGNLFFSSLIRKKLCRIFTYRHHTTADDMAAHLSVKNHSPMTIIVSGASGLIGSALVPFLTTGGHRVIKLVRRPPAPEKDEVFWDPVSGILNPEDIEGVDAVIHLAGENIGQGRWTKKKKKTIVESRNKGTDLIAKTLAGLNRPPKVMICASAIGYYGDRGNTLLTESDGPGNDFISSVCSQWEKAAAPVEEKGIRTVFLRIGVVLNPRGGALSRLLLPFTLGLGGKMGSGAQFMSWIGLDDVIGSIHHVLFQDDVCGPLNAVSPAPVTNLEFTKTLGKVLLRPTVFSIPASVITMVFGEMGREILLSSTRVNPEKLIKTGYRFRHPSLEGLLMHVLGKNLG